jgi:hypothetical protein
MGMQITVRFRISNERRYETPALPVAMATKWQRKVVYLVAFSNEK